MLQYDADTKTFSFNITLNFNVHVSTRSPTNGYDVLIVLLVIVGVLSYVYVNNKLNVPAQNSREPVTNELKEKQARRIHTAVPGFHAEGRGSFSGGEETPQQPRTRPYRTFDTENVRSKTEYRADTASDAPVIIIDDEEDSGSSDDDKMIPFRAGPRARIQLSPALQRWQQNYSVPPIVEFPSESRAVVTARHTGGGKEVVVRPRLDVARIDVEIKAWKPYFDVIAKEMSADFAELGSNLELPQDQIRAVKLENPGDCRSSCRHVLDLWRKKNGRYATVNTLIKAVQETDHNDVAENLSRLNGQLCK